MTKHTYAAPFSFGTVFRTTARTYGAAWAIFHRPDSETPVTGFSGSAALAQKQIASYRANGCTGPSEITSVCVVAN